MITGLEGCRTLGNMQSISKQTVSTRDLSSNTSTPGGGGGGGRGGMVDLVYINISQGLY